MDHLKMDSLNHLEMMTLNKPNHNAAHAFQKKHERKSDFKERLNWLKSNET